MTEPEGSSVAGSIRVVTLNLWGRSGDWTERRSVLVDGLRELRPDLVTFQEAITTDEYDQVLDLLGPEFHVAHPKTDIVVSDGRLHAASIASRWPLGEVREVDLRLASRADVYPCTTLVAEVATPDPIGPLLLVDHGPSWELRAEAKRELQAVIAAQLIEELVGQRWMHVVVGGDFNAVPDAASMRFWTGRRSLSGLSVCYEDAWERQHPRDPGHTFTPRNPLVSHSEWSLEPGRRIDYILVRCDDHGPTLDVSTCERIFDEPVDGVWASDHFGVVADLVVPVRI